ncbi:p53-induced death domain-containing protein 1-like [Branchiostoma floridae x Branchiostoma japonicum]
MSVSRYKHITRLKVGPEGGKLRTTPCTVIVPGGAVTKKTEITCGVIIPNDFTLPLEDGAMLVSDVIELGPHGTTFHQPVTVQMQYSSVLPGGAMEAVILVTEDRSQWKKLKTTKLGENKVSVSVNHFSIFAVVIQPKQEQFTVSTEGWTQVSSTQPAVQVSFSEGAVTTPSQVTLQVQEVPKQAVEDTEAEDQSSCRLISASPIVKAETISDSAVQFLKPITVRVPHPHRYMDIQHEGPTQLRVMSCEEGVDDWVDETDNTTIRVSDVFVEFEVTHFTRWIVIVVTSSYDDPEELDPLPLKALRLSKWLKQRTVQFILMQRKDNANEFVIECTCTPAKHADKKHTTLLGKGYKGPLPTDSVKLFEGQIVEIDLLGYVSIAPFVPKPQITFHSQKSNRFHLQIVAVEAKGQPHFAGKGVAAFYALPRVEVSEKKMKKKEKKGRSVTVRKEYDNLGNPPEYQKRFFLCQLPIHVPIRTTKLAPEQDAGTSKGVEMYFFFIKSHVSTDWKDLAFHLGIKWATIRNIAGRNRDDKSCCMDMLQEWKKREGDAATTGVLMKALSEAELQSVVDGLKKKFPDIVPGNQ